MIYDVDYFINKFSAIPEALFITHSQGLKEPIGNTPHCSAGWCKSDNGYFGRSTVNYDSCFGFSFSSELVALVELLKDPSAAGYLIADINNGDDPRYQQPTPKQRILAALYDIKKAQQPEVKEKVRYVTVDSSVRELQQKELSVN